MKKICLLAFGAVILLIILILNFNNGKETNRISNDMDASITPETEDNVGNLSSNQEISSTPVPVDMNKIIDDFMTKINDNDLMDMYAVEYGTKFDYIYDEETIDEFKDGYKLLISRMDKTLQKIDDADAPDELKDFKVDLLNLLKQKNELLKQQAIAIEQGGKWGVKYKHGMDVNINMALDHYGNYQELIDKIQNYNDDAKLFLEKYQMNKEKYELGDYRNIFFIM